MRVLTPEQMRLAERKSGEYGITLAKLMDNAGKALAQAINDINDTVKPEHINCKERRVTFLAGSGNNGGDCFVAAKELAENENYRITVVNLCKEPSTDIAAYAYQNMPFEKIEVIKGYKQANEDYINDVTKSINFADIVVDGVFGTGFHGTLSDDISEFFSAALNKIKVSVDVPSGGNASDGCISTGCFKADFTVTMGSIKSGMTQYPLKDFCGKIIVQDIGIPEAVFDEVKCGMEMQLAEESMFRKIRKTRSSYSHKGDFGNLLVIAGSESMRGACALAVRGALRSGAGLVRTASVGKCIDTLSALAPESMYISLESDKNGFMRLDGNEEKIAAAMKKSTAVLIGCGIGVTDETRRLVGYVIKNCECPIIIDADGINCISGSINILGKRKSDIILTPHPGEMSRLTGKPISLVQCDRLQTALSFAKENGVTVVLKGAGTISADSKGCTVNCTGNSGMSCGGSGDVLAGIIASFAAQGYSPIEAASYGAYIHGKAGDFAADELGIEAMLPHDIIEFLPKAFKSIYPTT